MRISEFVDKYGKEFDLNYFTVHRLIKSGALKENIHYKKSYRGMYEKYNIIENGLLSFLKNGGRR